MNLTVLPIVFTTLSIGVIITRFFRFIRREQGQTLFKLLLTIGIWGGISYTSLFPAHIRALSRQFGFGENLNTFIFFGFVIVFVVLFRIIAIVERLEKLITEVVRKNALKDL